MEAIEPTQLAACDDQETAGSLSQALLPVIFIRGAGKVLLSSSVRNDIFHLQTSTVYHLSR